MKRYEKINQAILKAWEKGDPETRVSRYETNEGKGIALTYKNGAAMALVPDVCCPFNFDQLTKQVREQNVQTVLDHLLPRLEDSKYPLTGRSEKEDKRTLVQIKSHDREVWVDQKLLTVFGTSPEFRLEASSNNYPLIAVYVEENLVGVVCPVRRKNEA